MKVHTNDFKTNISSYGRELDSIITYELDGNTIELGNDDLNSVTSHYKGDILKSVMKQLDIDSNVDIPVGTTINYQFGVKVGNSYEYLDFGNYIVYSSEKQEDVNSYKIVAYDKMLYSMVDYEDIGITYPITIRNYINAICTHLGITFANANDPFTNYDKEIPSELYLSNGNSMGYKFRDVLDELAQVTASTICINDDDELEIRYVQEIEHAIETKTGTNVDITNAIEKPIQESKLSKLSTQDGTPTPSNPVEVNTVKGYRNLLDVLDLDQTYSSVECVKNSDNSYTLDGTASSNYAINIIDNWSLTLPAGTYTLYGCPDMGGKDTLSIELYSNSPNNKYFTDEGHGITFTIAEERTFRCYIAIKNTKQYNNVKVYPMLVEGRLKLPYKPYGNNYIYEKFTGKNLFDKDNPNILNAKYGTTITSDNNERMLYIPCEPNTTYTLYHVASSPMRNSIGSTQTLPAIGVAIEDGVYSTTSPKTITTNANAKYIVWQFYAMNDTTTTLQQMLDSIQIEKGDQATTYEPYKEKIILIPLYNNEICGIGDYKDELVIDKNGHATLTKKIGKVVLDGSEDWSARAFPDDNYLSIKMTLQVDANGGLCDRFVNNNSYNVVEEHLTVNKQWQECCFAILKSRLSTPNAAGFKTWLSNNNTTVYYVLATPTTIDLGYITSPTLFSGTNIISNSDTMDMSIKYLTTQITNDVIDEEFFKDVNVDFGEKYGPINSIVLSRSAGSDNIYEQDNASILANGLCELKISDNQIMNGNDRDEYLQGIFSRLNGLEYYINDYSSTGITYYDICDRYIARIGNNDYSCVMFNDEILVTQGLEENIYTEMPIPSETDYSKADKTDRRINQAYIIVDKVNGEISSVTNRVQTLENEDITIKRMFNDYTPVSRTVQIETSVNQLQTDTYTKTEINTKLTDGSVTKVQTVSGTFDVNGMTYEKTNAPTKTTINEVGINTKRASNNETILFAGYVDDNNTQYADFRGQTIVATENIIVKHYMVVGQHSRFEDYENGTGCFFIG